MHKSKDDGDTGAPRAEEIQKHCLKGKVLTQDLHDQVLCAKIYLTQRDRGRDKGRRQERERGGEGKGN